MNNTQYQNFPGVSSHRLIAMLESPAACWRKYLDPERSEPPQTESTLLGTMVHVLALTPHEFDDEFLVADFERRSKAGKARYAELSRYGLKVVRPQTADKAKAIAAALLADSEARRLLDGGTKERVFIEPRGESLLPLKARLDIHHAARRHTVELKTIRDINQIGPTINKYHYLLSATFYRTISKSDSVTFVFVQTAEPLTVAIFDPTDSQLDDAAEQMDAALNRFDACWWANNWPEAEPMNDDDDPLMMPFSMEQTDLLLGELAL